MIAEWKVYHLSGYPFCISNPDPQIYEVVVTREGKIIVWPRTLYIGDDYVL